MPKKSIDYLNQDVYFYKLVCKDLEIKDVCVGSTMNMTKRLHSHKNMCKNQHRKEFNYPVYIRIRDSGGFGNWSMVLIDRHDCKDRLDAERIERQYIEMMKPTLNKYMSSLVQALQRVKLKKTLMHELNQVKQQTPPEQQTPSKSHEIINIGYEVDQGLTELIESNIENTTSDHDMDEWGIIDNEQ